MENLQKGQGDHLRTKILMETWKILMETWSVAELAPLFSNILRIFADQQGPKTAYAYE